MKKIIKILFVLATLIASTTLVTAHQPKQKLCLYEQNATGDDTAESIYGSVYYFGQTFVVTTQSHMMEKIDLKLYRIGHPGKLTVYVTTFDTAWSWIFNIVSTGTYDGNTLTTCTAGNWVSINMKPAKLTYGHAYAIFVKAYDGDHCNKVMWREDMQYFDPVTNTYYPSLYDGPYCGRIWNNEWTPDALWGQGWFSNADFMFKEYGKHC